MLIKALNDYYDVLAASGKVLPPGYSKVKIHYLVPLTSDGKIDGALIDIQRIEEITVGKGKIKQRKRPVELQMPERREIPAIGGNIVEHRPTYIFGLNVNGDELTPDDRTGKARESHKAFVETSINFLEGLDSPLINAFRLFAQRWEPEKEINNKALKGIGKDLNKVGFAFCLSGSPDHLLHDEPLIKAKWEKEYKKRIADDTDMRVSQCAVSGENAPIAKTHSKIKGVFGGSAAGTVLVGFNNDSETSYGNEQSYNSNISETVMKHYTEALNYLLSDNKHKVTLDDLTVVFWAMSPGGEQEDLFIELLFGKTDKMNAAQTEDMLREMWRDGRSGKITTERLKSLDKIQSDVDFYMVGIKPNIARLSVKFMIRKKYADILWNIAEFQRELQITKEIKVVPLWKIGKELVSPKSQNDKTNPALMTRLLESIIYGTPYPLALLETMIRRVKTDDVPINSVRAGVIKACINRNYPKEDLKVGLNKDNRDPAYLCGRLFAVLEKLQQAASNNSLNRTIRDTYFASAAAKPLVVFPKLLRLAQNHLKKVKGPKYNERIGIIINQLEDEFPNTLSIKDQGKFIIGYYQQYRNIEFFEDKQNDNIKKEEQ